MKRGAHFRPRHHRGQWWNTGAIIVIFLAFVVSVSLLWALSKNNSVERPQVALPSASHLRHSANDGVDKVPLAVQSSNENGASEHTDLKDFSEGKPSQVPQPPSVRPATTKAAVDVKETEAEEKEEKPPKAADQRAMEETEQRKCIMCAVLTQTQFAGSPASDKELEEVNAMRLFMFERYTQIIALAHADASAAEKSAVDNGVTQKQQSLFDGVKNSTLKAVLRFLERTRLAIDARYCLNPEKSAQQAPMSQVVGGEGEGQLASVAQVILETITEVVNADSQDIAVQRCEGKKTTKFLRAAAARIRMTFGSIQGWKEERNDLFILAARASVVQLDLGFNGIGPEPLVGGLPLNWLAWELPFLEALFLTGNNISTLFGPSNEKHLPSPLQRFPLLSRLSLKHNQLQSIFPSVTLPTTLVHLILSDNPLTSRDPQIGDDPGRVSHSFCEPTSFIVPREKVSEAPIFRAGSGSFKISPDIPLSIVQGKMPGIPRRQRLSFSALRKLMLSGTRISEFSALFFPNPTYIGLLEDTQPKGRFESMMSLLLSPAQAMLGEFDVEGGCIFHSLELLRAARAGMTFNTLAEEHHHSVRDAENEKEDFSIGDGGNERNQPHDKMILPEIKYRRTGVKVLGDYFHPSLSDIDALSSMPKLTWLTLSQSDKEMFKVINVLKEPLQYDCSDSQLLGEGTSGFVLLCSVSSIALKKSGIISMKWKPPPKKNLDVFHDYDAGTHMFRVAIKFFKAASSDNGAALERTVLSQLTELGDVRLLSPLGVAEASALDALQWIQKAVQRTNKNRKLAADLLDVSKTGKVEAIIFPFIKAAPLGDVPGIWEVSNDRFPPTCGLVNAMEAIPPKKRLLAGLKLVLDVTGGVRFMHNNLLAPLAHGDIYAHNIFFSNPPLLSTSRMEKWSEVLQDKRNLVGSDPYGWAGKKNKEDAERAAQYDKRVAEAVPKMEAALQKTEAEHSVGMLYDFGASYHYSLYTMNRTIAVSQTPSYELLLHTVQASESRALRRLLGEVASHAISNVSHATLCAKQLFSDGSEELNHCCDDESATKLWIAIKNAANERQEFENGAPRRKKTAMRPLERFIGELLDIVQMALEN